MAAAVTGQTSLARRVVRAARAFDRLTPELVAKVKTGLLDMLSCAFAARELPWGAQAIRMVSRAPGGRCHGDRHAFPRGRGRSCVRQCNAGPWAGARGHAHRRGEPSGRGDLPGAAGARRNKRKSRGRDFILAAVCGYEIGAAVGRAIMDQEMVRRFRPTGITGPLAGAMAGSRLLGLDEEATVSALGFAANATGGLNEWPYSGGDEMFFHPGFAARNAVTAVELAELGALASETALDGPSGLFAALGKAGRVSAVAPFSGEAPEILSVYYKPAPACNYAQTACQAALALNVPSDRDRGDYGEGFGGGGGLSGLQFRRVRSSASCKPR